MLQELCANGTTVCAEFFCALKERKMKGGKINVLTTESYRCNIRTTKGNHSEERFALVYSCIKTATYLWAVRLLF